MSGNAELIERYRNGSEDAGNEMVERNMGLVYSVVKRFANRGCEIEDLVQIGSIGLIKAVKKFDTSFNVQFSTYAVPMIIGEIKRFLRDDGAVKVSRSIKEKAAKGRHAEEGLRSRLGRNPTIGEISKESGIAEDELIEAFEAAAAPESLQAGIWSESEDNSNTEKIERLTADDTEEQIVNRVFIREALSALSKREYEILQMRYFKEKTQTEIAKIMGVSQVQISRIEKKALQKMRACAVTDTQVG